MNFCSLVLSPRPFSPLYSLLVSSHPFPSLYQWLPIYVFIVEFSSECHSQIPGYLFDICMWMCHRHLKITVGKTDLLTVVFPCLKCLPFLLILYMRSQKTMDCGPNPAPTCLCKYSFVGTQPCSFLCVVCGCFYATMAETLQPAKLIYYLALYRKSLPIPALCFLQCIYHNLKLYICLIICLFISLLP